MRFSVVLVCRDRRPMLIAFANGRSARSRLFTQCTLADYASNAAASTRL